MHFSIIALPFNIQIVNGIFILYFYGWFTHVAASLFYKLKIITFWGWGTSLLIAVTDWDLWVPTFVLNTPFFLFLSTLFKEKVEGKRTEGVKDTKELSLSHLFCSIEHGSERYSRIISFINFVQKDRKSESRVILSLHVLLRGVPRSHGMSESVHGYIVTLQAWIDAGTYFTSLAGSLHRDVDGAFYSWYRRKG